MNECAILGRVCRTSGAGISGVLVTLQRLTFGDGSYRVPVRDISGSPVAHCHTDEDGFFLMRFTFDPINIGVAMERLRYRIIAQSERPEGRGVAMHVMGHHDSMMYPVVSLRRIADGVIPDPRSPGSVPGYLQQARRLIEIFQQIRGPNTPLPSPSGGRPTPGRVRTRGIMTTPSPEYYAFFGVAEIIV